MKLEYHLRIDSEHPAELDRILGVGSRGPGGGWQIVRREGPTDPPVAFVDEFLSVLDGKYEALEGLGINRDRITMWVLYEYDQQCNLEFNPDALKRLGNNGISLCVSCWQAPD
jgi:hypothetical protein